MILIQELGDMRRKEEYSHYEKIRIISARALQISQGAPVLAKIPKGMINPVEIAKVEWENSLIPIETRHRTF